MIRQLVTKTTITLEAANQGNKTTPTTPTVVGISNKLTRIILNNLPGSHSLMQQQLPNTFNQIFPENMYSSHLNRVQPHHKPNKTSLLPLLGSHT
jgi:hypothetical protein